jgi:glutamine---fructose-6-phosphate transaminase (isomerizing)
MCGIFGVFIRQNSHYRPEFIKKVLNTIAMLSESRGKDSSGLAFINYENNQIDVFKGAMRIRDLLRSPELIQFEKACKLSSKIGKGMPFSVIGHARLVTNGSQLHNINNQPVIKDGIVGTHNGIIVNVDELWASNAELKRNYTIDTEILLALVWKYLKQGFNPSAAVSKAIQKLSGTVATTLILADSHEAVLTTNNGSLYTLLNQRDFIVFASEAYFLKEMARRLILHNKIGDYNIEQIDPGTGLVINLLTHNFEQFLHSNPSSVARKTSNKQTSKICVHEVTGGNQKEVVVDISKIHINPKAAYESSILEHNYERISKLRRCSKCLLPETFPFIEYDEQGICNYCKNFKHQVKALPISRLFELVEPYRKSNHKADCLVPFSGGRDSTYTLHLTKNVLKLNPIAFTYDWGMVTDLGRRNIARVCGKLGIENIIISADIHWKRKNIQKNVRAWLKRPDLGMIPLFMAGDKYFFYYTNKIKKQMDIKLNIWGINKLENTDFKVGFCGVKPDFNKERIYSLSILSQLRLFQHVAKNLLSTPSYINGSVFDTLGSFAARYFAPKGDYFHIFDFYTWNEKEIEELILNEYKWEKAIDTRTTWRIGDGTAGFYNYIYYTIAGFSEYDTFRSNQIREGMISREQGLKLIDEENQPRYDSIKWYLDIINMNFEATITRINSIPKLYL